MLRFEETEALRVRAEAAEADQRQVLDDIKRRLETAGVSEDGATALIVIIWCYLRFYNI